MTAMAVGRLPRQSVDGSLSCNIEESEETEEFPVLLDMEDLATLVAVFMNMRGLHYSQYM